MSTVPLLADSMELRKRVRYRLGTKAVFSWKDSDGKQSKGVGVTRDINLGGVFIFTSACPAVDTEIRITIFLPPSGKSAPGTRIESRGTVLRVERSLGNDDLSGFAAASTRFTLY
jgi:hypothetical protein